MQKTKFTSFSTGSKFLATLELIYFSTTLVASAHLLPRLGLSQAPEINGNVLYIQSIIFALTVQLSAIALGLFNPSLRESFRGILRRIVLSGVLGFSCFTILISVLPVETLPTRVTLSSVAACVSGSVLIRYLFYCFDLFHFGRRNVLILGAGERASIIERRMRRRVDRQRFNILGFVPMQGDSAENGILHEELCDIDLNNLVSYVLENNIDQIVVACDERRNNLPVEELFTCRVRGVSVVDILDFIERETGQVAVSLIHPSWIIYSSGFSSSHQLRIMFDNSFNSAMALLLLAATWPFLLIAALAIKLEDGWHAPVLYKQKRVGVNGRVFQIYKFRSMRIDAEVNGPVWAAKNDDRITAVGKIIRKYRIDELPQIWNVLNGDMGFVGPRPERPEFVQELNRKIPYYNQRHNVKPGLTGWAILQYPYGDTDQAALEKLQYDLYYVKHRSFLLDMHILIRTAEIILFGRGR